jgi:SAGA-associated factor 73
LHWLALGDSYSAGVGAGSLLNNPWDPKLKCMTTDGSYPKRLEKGYEELKQGIEFLSCTGDVISNINGAGSHDRDSQLELMKGIRRNTYNFATLSIGGNDLGFSNIVKSCIMVGSVMGNCEEALKKAERISGVYPRDSASYSDAFANLTKVYLDILDTAGEEFTLVVTGYAEFFAAPEENPDCNDGQIQLASKQDLKLPTRPSLPLTQELRSRINAGVWSFNAMIQDAVSETQQGLERDEKNKRILFVDINPVFEGHRFCEKGASTESGWPEFTNRAWFFSSPFRSDILPDGRELAPRADDGSPRLQLDRRDSAFCDDPYNEWDCVLGELLERDPDMPLNEKEFPRGSTLYQSVKEWSKSKIMKAFHPKTIAYDAIARRIADKIAESSTEQ